MKNRIRKLLISILLCALIPTSTIVASAQTSRNTPPGMIVSVPAGVTSSDVLSDPQYLIYQSYLEENSEITAVLYNGIYSLQSRIDVTDFHLPLNNVRVLMHMMSYSFPELFYLNGYSCMCLNNTVLYIEPNYSVDNAEEKRRAFFEITEMRYLSLIDDSMDDFTKAVILHDALALNARYADSEDIRLANNYTFLTEGWGVCQQYTECYAYLLARCGIKSEMIQSSSMSHSWLKIELDGSYYNVDLTWDDPTPEKTGKVNHRYFLFSDSAFQTADTALHRESHDGYLSVHPADSAQYDRFSNLHSFTTQLCYLDGAFYAITPDGKLVRYDHHTDEITVLSLLPYKWPAGENYYWIGNYSSLVPFNAKLYYNSPDEIYQYDPETDETELFAENTGEEKLYGLRIVDNQLWVVRADSPNEGFIASTYLTDLPVPDPSLIIGDADGDGSVLIIDATAIQRYLANLPIPAFNREAADCDGDKEVTIIDATAIQRWLAGLSSSLAPNGIS